MRRPSSLLPALLPTLLLALLFAPAAHADRAGDLMLQEALLRQYSTAEAEQRYEAYRKNPDAATQALGSGMSNLVGRMYQRSQERVAAAAAVQETRDRFWQAVLDGKDIQLRNGDDRRLLVQLLEGKSNEGYWPATQRLVEYALWLRPGSEAVFEQPMEPQAAYLLRRAAYGTEGNYEYWASGLLAKLYLVGRGVPRDEEEALRLFTYCAQGVGQVQASGARGGLEDAPAIRARCGFNAARIWEKGWGVDADKAKADKLRQDATAHYNKMNKTQLTVAQVEETIRP